MFGDDCNDQCVIFMYASLYETQLVVMRFTTLFAAFVRNVTQIDNGIKVIPSFKLPHSDPTYLSWLLSNSWKQW